jgi:arabinofuranosyltransferase
VEFIKKLTSATNIPVLLLALGLGMWSFSVFPEYSGDDCYIAYRYAYNIYHHKQYVFNLGERILATTSPLYTLILAGLQVFSDNLSRVSHVISFISSSLAGFLMFLILKDDNLPLGLFCAVCFPLTLGGTGLETHFLMLLFTLGIFLFQRGRYLSCSVILGLCFLTRQDSAVFIFCMIIMYLLKKGRIPRREFVVFVVTIAPWFIFCYLYFGSLLPTSLQAKKGYASLIQYFYNAFCYLAGYCDRYNFNLLSFMSQKVADILSPASLYSRYIFKGSLCALYFPIILLGLVYYRRNLARFSYAGVIFYIYPALMIAALSLIAPPVEHRWHLTHAVTFALIGQLNLVTSAALWVAKRKDSSFLGRRAFSRGVVVLVSLYLLYFVGLNIKDFRTVTKGADEIAGFGGRFHSYKNIGLFLRDHVSEDKKVFALEVGTIGYYSDKRMIDGAGLVSPGYDVYHRNGCWLLGMEKEFPDYIVAEEVSIPFYKPIFSYVNNFGKQVVYRKSTELPADSYPFLTLVENYKKWQQKRLDRQEGYETRKTGKAHGLIERIMTYFLNKYRR